MQNKRYDYRFSEEDFNKLTQLDRIEYRQREDRVYKDFDFSFISVAIISFQYLFAFMIIVAVAGYGSFGVHFFILMIGVMLVLIRLFIVLFLLAVIGDMIMSYYKRKQLKLLKDSYFKIEVRKK